jgi:hypothetical protein
MNYVSQLLHAGGVAMNSDWHMRNLEPASSLINKFRGMFFSQFKSDWDVTSTWSVAQDNYQYFRDPNNGFINGQPLVFKINDLTYYANSGGIRTGDLLYFSNDGGQTVHHATIVSAVGGGTISYTGHTDPRIDWNLRESLGTETAIVIRINDSLPVHH